MGNIILAIYLLGVPIAYYFIRQIMRKAMIEYGFRHVLLVMFASAIWPIVGLVVAFMWVCENIGKLKPPRWM